MQNDVAISQEGRSTYNEAYGPALEEGPVVSIEPASSRQKLRRLPEQSGFLPLLPYARCLVLENLPFSPRSGSTENSASRSRHRIIAIQLRRPCGEGRRDGMSTEELSMNRYLIHPAA